MAHFVTGLFTELITAFHENGDIDYKMTGDLVDFQISKGVENFFVNGLGGESHELSMDEQVEVLKEVHSRTKGKGKLMACSFQNTVAENEKLIDLYEKTGLADCYCITAPPFFRHTPASLYDYAARLIDHARRPVYIYNCVQMGTLFSPEVLEKLYKEHPNFRGYKDATVDMVHFLQTTMRIDKDNFDFLGGCDGLDGLMMTLGAVGCVSFMAVPFPAEMKAICDYGLAGENEKCMAMQYKVLRIRNVLKLAPFNAAYMYAQKFTGGPVVKYTRMPAHQAYVPDEVKAIIDAAMKDLGY
jgi:4-hydroxy-tetrahydrodipicolinate synthase